MWNIKIKKKTQDLEVGSINSEGMCQRRGVFLSQVYKEFRQNF